jgi:hypothetical protein
VAQKRDRIAAGQAARTLRARGTYHIVRNNFAPGISIFFDASTCGRFAPECMRVLASRVVRTAGRPHGPDDASRQ